LFLQFYSTIVLDCPYLISNFQSLLIPRSIHSADYARSDNACCPPSPPSPDSKSSSQSEWSANTHPTHPCRPPSTCFALLSAGPSRSTPRTSPPSGARLSLSACLSIIFSGPCATGAALLVLVLFWCCVVLLLAAAGCWLLGPSFLLLALALALWSLPRCRLLQFRSWQAATIATARTSQETSRP